MTKSYLLLIFSILFGATNNIYSLEQEVKRITLNETIALRYNRTIETAYLNRLAEKFDLKVAQDKFHLAVFLLAQRNIEISRLSLERSRNLLENNRILIAEGRLARVEIIQTEADLANQEFSFQENQNRLDSTRLQLLDIDRNTLIEPVESIQVQAVNLDEQILQQTSFSNQSNYLQALLSHKNSQTGLLLAENIDIADAVRDINMRWKQIQLAKKALKLSQKQLEIELEKLTAKLSNNFQIVAFQVTGKIEPLDQMEIISPLKGRVKEFPIQ